MSTIARLTSAFLFGAAASLWAQADHPRSAAAPAAAVHLGTIDGIVSDSNFVPLAGADITIFGTRIRVETTESGRFRIRDIPVGQYLVIVRRVGYRPASAMLEVPAVDTLRLSYTLEPIATTLGTVVVTEQRVSLRTLDFMDRARRSMGQFMTEEQIERHNPTYATELIRTFMSVNVAPVSMKLSGGWYALSSRGDGSLLKQCPMTILVDEVPMPTPFNLDLLPSPREIAGIEVYAGPAQIPAKFHSYDRGCGVILVWTKDGG